MPSVQRAHDKLKKEGIQVITISLDTDGESAVRPVFAKGGYTLPAWIDRNRQVSRQFGARGVPYTVIVDKTGHINAGGFGHVNFDSKVLHDYVRKLAKQP
jgi:peroxiredoxin